MRTKTLFITLIIILAVSSCQKQIDKPNQSQAEETAARRGGPSKNAPVANAGIDITTFLPVGPIFLNGSASDADNNIVSVLWTKVSGPSSFSFDNATAAQTYVRNLVQGVYQFELKVTDKTRLVDRDTIQVTVNASSIQPPPCTTNCGRIVFVSDRDGNNEIYTCTADGSNITRLTNDDAADEDPAWSPDGTRIAFTREGNLFIMNANGSNVVQKTFTSDVWKPAWSPDGNKMAFTDIYTEYGWGVIMVMDLTNGAVSELLYTAGEYVFPTPSWSPDGTKIAFESDMVRATGRSAVFTISPEDSGLTGLTPFSYSFLLNPSWSPDGMKLSVTSYSETNPNTESIAVMNADGTGLTIIKTGIVSGYYYHTRTSWSPDRTRIAYTDSNTIKWVAANGSSSGIIITNGWDADWKH